MLLLWEANSGNFISNRLLVRATAQQKAANLRFDG